MDEEERSYPERFKWEAELRYKLYHHDHARPFVPAPMLNIGSQGLAFISQQKIPLGSIIILKLFQHQDYTPVKVLAKVHFCESISEEKGFEIDCVFHDLSQEEIVAVTEIVEEVSFIHRVHSKVKESLNDKKHAAQAKQKRTRHE